jgi:CRP/FNR family transcriptional regulator, cyclic AMP receptor protein
MLFPRGSFLGGLPASTRAAMLGLGTPRWYDPGRILLREGEWGSHVLLLVTGFVKVTAISPEGYLSLLSIRTGGDLVGELASLDGESRVATVTAAGRVLARVVGQAAFRRCLTEYPDAALAVSGSVGAKLRWATRRRIDFGGREVHVRLARVLVELAATYGTEGSAGTVIEVPLSQPELAALVGAAEPTVHRALAALRREEVVATGYRRIVVCDRERLAALAGGSGEHGHHE